MENDPRTMRRQDLEAEILRLREAVRANQELQKQMKGEIERLLKPVPPALDAATAQEGAASGCISA